MKLLRQWISLKASQRNQLLFLKSSKSNLKKRPISSRAEDNAGATKFHLGTMLVAEPPRTP